MLYTVWGGEEWSSGITVIKENHRIPSFSTHLRSHPLTRTWISDSLHIQRNSFKLLWDEENPVNTKQQLLKDNFLVHLSFKLQPLVREGNSMDTSSLLLVPALFLTSHNQVKENFILLVTMWSPSRSLFPKQQALRFPDLCWPPMSPWASKFCKAMISSMIPNKILMDRNSEVLTDSFPKLNNTYKCKVVILKIIHSPIEKKNSHCIS